MDKEKIIKELEHKCSMLETKLRLSNTLCEYQGKIIEDLPASKTEGCPCCNEEKLLIEEDIKLGFLGHTLISCYVDKITKFLVISSAHEQDLYINIKHCPMCGRKLRDDT